MHVYINGSLIPESEAKISVFDHGFLYGDGVFETMRAYNGTVFMIEEHIQRLFRSASLIGLDIKRDKDSIKTTVYETISKNSLKDAYIRVTVSRGTGPIGLDPDLCKEPAFIIIAEEFREYPAAYYQNGIKTIIAETRRNIKEAINPQIKSLNFLNNILAKIEAKKKNAYEALMLNAQGYLAEGTISNLFFVLSQYEKTVLCMPSLDCGILDGITRNIVLELAQKSSIPTKESKFKKEDIYRASEVFITNTTMEIMPVCAVDSVSYQVGTVTKLLHKAYKENVKVYLLKSD
ncbi:MAG: branched-chain-amino-acid transaminase [Thermodesulfovibrionales bacterium]|nr:branched-chain-amino-acid transaminase [Thermodesulfovibrionales bacterium]